MKKYAWFSGVILLVLLAWLLWPDSGEVSSQGVPEVSVSKPSPAQKKNNRPPRAWQEIVQDDDPDGSLRLEGQVLDESDLPVDGAQVFISTNPGRTATAERDGSFSFEGLIEKSYRLSARRGMLAGGPVVHRLTPTSQPVIIRLATGSVVKVSVVTSRRSRPVADAEIGLRGFRTAGRQTGRTDAAGIARFEGVMPGFCVVSVQADGFAPVQRHLAVPRGGQSATRIRIVLSAGVFVSGKVITDAGHPVAGARVVASESGALFPRMDREFFHALSDAQGGFVIPALVPGSYRLTARHADHPPASTRPLTIERSTDDIEIVMSAGARIQGRVVTQDNHPVPWAEVRLRESGRGFRFRSQRGATADRDGVFEFSGLPRQQVQLMAIGEVGSSQVAEVDLTDSPTVTGITLRLTQLGRIAGRVIDSQGQAAPEVYVSAVADFLAADTPQDVGMRRRLQTTTDGGGNFVFKGLSEGSYRLQASRIQLSGRGRFFLRGGVKASTGDEDVTLTIEDAGGIRGRVVLASSEVPERFGVALDWNPPVPFEASQGDFELTPVEPGDHRIVISGENFADHHIPEVRVESQKTTELGEIVIQPGRTVTGRVLDREGRPVEGAKVMVDRFLAASGTSLRGGFRPGNMDQGRNTATASDGSFRLESLSTEARVIAAEHSERGRSDVVRLPPGKEDTFVELTLHGFGSVEGLVTSAMTPVAEARISARPVSGGTRTMVTAGADGRYLIEKLPEGQHSIEATRGGGHGRGRDSLRRNITVRAEETAQVHFQFDVGEATLVVNVAGENQASIDLAWVSLFQGQAAFTVVSELFAAQTSYEGTVRSMLWRPGRPARFPRLVPGEYSACVVPLSGELAGFRRMRMLRKNADRIRVHCRPCPVAETTQEQQFTAVVPPMEPLSGDHPVDQAVKPDAGMRQIGTEQKRIAP